jgi:hypothetical protein
MTIGELAAQAGVSTRTLRFWADEGLIPCERTVAGYRSFGSETLPVSPPSSAARSSPTSSTRPSPASTTERMRLATPDLPDDPSAEQVAAWVELAQIVQDPAFRARLREMAGAGAGASPPDDSGAALAAAVAEHAGAALDAGVDPTSPHAAAVVERIASEIGRPSPSSSSASATPGSTATGRSSASSTGGQRGRRRSRPSSGSLPL